MVLTPYFVIILTVLSTHALMVEVPLLPEKNDSAVSRLYILLKTDFGGASREWISLY